MDGTFLADGLLWYAAFLFSTTFHEAAHALVSYRLGDPTAYHGGQVTLDPLPHIRREPIGTVLVPLVSYLAAGWMVGWASAPYDPAWAHRYPRRAAVMALAGPVSNLLLLALAGIGIRMGIALDAFQAPESIGFASVAIASAEGPLEHLARGVSVLFTLNVVLFAFNLLPVPPLDGSGVIPLALTESTARKYQRVIANPAFALIGILLAWNLFKYVFRPIHLLAINLLYPDVGYR